MAEGEGCRRAAGAGKLSLKRKRPPGDEPPQRKVTIFASNSPWFEEQGLNDTQSPWVALIKAVKPPLTYSNLERVIKLPQFLEKRSQSANLHSKRETFIVGTKQFEWVPFPQHHREDAKASDSKTHDSANETVSLIGKEEDESLIPLVPEQKHLTANECAAEESRMSGSIIHSTKLETGERNEKCQHAHQQDMPELSTLAAVPGFSKKFDFPEYSEETTMKDGGKSRRGSEMETSNDALIHHATWFEATPVLPAQESSSVSFSSQTKSDDSRTKSTLDRCPMCQMHFTGTWSELDLDSHLAQCLSESTEDVFW